MGSAYITTHKDREDVVIEIEEGGEAMEAVSIFMEEDEYCSWFGVQDPLCVGSHCTCLHSLLLLPLLWLPYLNFMFFLFEFIINLFILSKKKKNRGFTQMGDVCFCSVGAQFQHWCNWLNQNFFFLCALYCPCNMLVYFLLRTMI